MLEFEWDEQKAAENLKKHGVSFEMAVQAFVDPNGVRWIDDRENYGEERMILLCAAQGRVFYVVYTERGERIRIVSTRRASKREQESYYRQETP